MDSSAFGRIPVWPIVVFLILFGMACIGLWELACWAVDHVSVSWK